MSENDSERVVVGRDVAGPATTGPDLPAGPEPWEAVGWSAVFPGLGHVHLGRKRAGAFIAATWLVLVVACIATLFAKGVPFYWTALLLVLSVALQAWAMLDSHRIARERLSADADAARRSQRDAWKGLLLTRVLPGLGHVYDGRNAQGVGFLLGMVGLGVVLGAWQGMAELIVAPLASAELWYHFRGRPGGPSSRMWHLVLAGLVVGAIQMGLPAGLRTSVVRAFRVPSESMNPTLRVGDYCYVDMTRRGHAARGDVVVFPFPSDPSKQFVKRVFAVAGDVVEFRRDGAWRNGRLALRPPVLPGPAAGDSTGLPFAGEGRPFRVPDGQLFLVGDNFLHSNDSRFFGPVPERTLVGSALKIYWPPGRSGAIPGSPQTLY